MTEEKHSILFEHISIGKVEIKNRIAMAPMGIMGLTTSEGGFSQRAIDFYVERAKGGTGLIITGAVKVENEIDKHTVLALPCATLNSRHFIMTASELTERVQAYGSRIFVQLTAGMGRVNAPERNMHEDHVIPVAPSPIPNYWNPNVTCRAITTEEVEQLVRKFGDAAEISAVAGFDGIEIHAIHEGYLLDQFAIAMFNKRTDKYGGNLAGRLKLPLEIVQEIKRRVGKYFPVQLRYSIKSYIKGWRQGGLPGEEFKEVGRDLNEGLEAAKILEEGGYDAFNADAGSYDAWYWAHPPLYQEQGCYLPLTQELKKVVKVPVIVAGRMEVPDLASMAVVKGKADIVELGRGLLADPHWPNKVLEGRTRKIRPCLGCHDGCLGRMFKYRPLSCAVNPACGRERIYGIEPAAETRNVIVIGGGVAGMEAARVCAIRGHKVTIYEKNDRLGGHVVEASVPSFKEAELRLLSWYETELNELKIKINLNNEVHPDLLKKEKPDVVIVATGSKPVVLDIPGKDHDKVTTASEILLDKKEAGESVAVIGGGLIGCEIALWLSQQGRKVTIVEKFKKLMQAGNLVPRPNKIMLLDLLKFSNITIMTNSTLSEVTDDGPVIMDEFSLKKTLHVDTVVLAVGLKSDQGLYRLLVGNIPNLYLIGDGKQARNIMNAIWDAYEVARTI